MPSPDLSGEGKKEEVFERLSQLETQRKEAGEIVQRWFRFRGRRGLGVIYSLFSFIPVLGTILGTLGFSDYVIVAGVSVALVLSWVVGRAAGFQSFGKMRKTIGFLKDDSNRNYRAAPAFMALTMSAWLAYAIAAIMGLHLLAVVFALAWLVELVLYRVLTLHRNKNPIIDHRAEDWLVIFAFPLGAIISALQLLPGGPYFGFVLISPLVLFAGIKSLYDAPKELVNNIDESK